MKRAAPGSDATLRSALRWSLRLWLVLAPTPVLQAAEAPEGFTATLEALEQAAGGEVKVTRSPRTGFATFLSMSGRRGMPVPGASADAATPEARALAFLGSYGRLFGLRDNSQLQPIRTGARDSVGMDHVRFQQVHEGVPVTGAEMAVHLTASGVAAVNGRVLALPKSFATAPLIGPDRARAAAVGVLTKHLGVSDAELSEPRLEVFNLGFIGGPPRPTRLAWFIEARKIDVRELLWVDARTGGLLKRFSQLTSARSRKIYTANNGAALPGTLLRAEGGAPTFDDDADKAYDYSGDTYDYYLTQHGRDSYDGAGAAIKSTVHYCPNGCPSFFQNAFWNGSQMVYGEGFPAADDVDAHELTHAVTERTAGLFYYMQSGALNESFSDIFGETVDQTNGSGTDTPVARWYIGEDLPSGPGRHMMDPTLFIDPGKASDPQFVCEDNGLDDNADAGGVHTNSGIPNHAYALMVDGGSFNGHTVTGIGLAKAAKVQYRALTSYLLSASDFLDDYDALIQSCDDLVGTSGITGSDCTQVQSALDAVEMTSVWPCLPTQASAPATCPVGQGPADAFFDDFENVRSGKWTTTVLRTGNVWTGGVGTPPIYHADFATSGFYSLAGFDPDVVSDSTVNMSHGVVLPANARMQFDHSYGFENAGISHFDGGVIEYSLNNGATWSDAGSLIASGATYGGSIDTFNANPLAGRNAFVGESWGYTATQLDLSGLAGQSPRFRFRVGSDLSVADYGWFIDDVRIYACDVGGTVQLSAPTYNVGEAGPSVTLTVTRSGGAAGGVTVAYTTNDGNAHAGEDFTATAGTLTFDSNVTSRTFTIPIVNDTHDEGDESFSVVLSDPAGPTVTLGAQSSATVTIADNDTAGSIQLGAAAYSVAEGAGVATITVTRAGGTASDATVHYGTADDSADGNDYTTATGTLTFGAGVTKKTFQVPITNDALDESNEIVDLSLDTAGGGATLGPRTTATLTILDNDVGGVLQLTLAKYTAAEGAGGAVITVTRTGGAAGGVTVHYATADGTATAGSDYTGASGTLSFGAGVTTQTFIVPVTPDSRGENDETVLLSLSAATGGATLGARASATLTILEDETVLQFASPQFSVGEAAPRVTITVKRSGVTTGASTVRYAVSDGTALAGSDYTAIATGTLDFPPKVVSKTFTVPILNDAASEPDEFFVVELSSPTGAVLGPQDTATVLVTDDDAVLSFGAATYSGKEGGPAVVVTVKRTGNKTTAAGVHYATSPGSASTPSDYVDTSGDLAFGAGVLAQTFKVPINDDAEAEPTQTVGLTLSGVTGNARLGLAAAVLSIADNEPVLSFSAPTYSVNEGVGTATITVKRTGPAAPQVEVSYGAGVGGTATPGSDYTLTPGTLTFAPGVVVQTFTVTILPDATAEPPDTVNLTLSGASGASLGVSSAVLTIVDNDPSISFTAASYGVRESVKSAIVTVKRTGVLSAPATVDFSASGGTATVGSDFMATSGTLTFAAGVATRTFTVPILADFEDEPGETVQLTLGNPTGGAVGLGNATLTITDDDAATFVQFVTATFGGSETAGFGTVTVKRIGVTTSAVSVQYATGNGTALSGSDYTVTTGTLSFAPGETIKSFEVPIANDGIAEPNETVDLTLSNPGGGATLGAPSAAVMFIAGAAPPTLRIDDVSVAEGNAGPTSAGFTVTLSPVAAGTVTVDYATANGTAAASDYTSTSGTLTFSPGQTTQPINVPVAGDTAVEGNETFFVNLSNVSGGATISDGQGLGTIGNDDFPLLSVSDVTVTEGNAGTTSAGFLVTLSPAVTATVTVHYATANGSAAAGSDYGSTSGTLTFLPGQILKTIGVPVSGDLAPEATETFVVNLSAATGGAVIGDNQGQGTITNDDVRTLSINDVAVNEGNSGMANAVFTVTLSSAVTSGSVTVQYATSGVSASEGVDYSLASGTVTFTAGQTAKTIPVAVAGDAVVEGNETFVVNLTNAVNATIADSQGQGTIVNDDCAGDSDGDRLCDTYETDTGIYVSPTDTGTDPFNPDTDGDGIKDGDEVLGTVNGLDLPAMGTSPLKRNLLLEYDWMTDSTGCGAHSHAPTQAILNRVTAAFAAAPNTNPDGSTGIAILHDFGQGGAFTGGNFVSDADGKVTGGVNGTNFQALKAANFVANRNGYFHYVILAHEYTDFPGSSGQAELPGDDLIVSMGCFGSTEGTSNTIMHELGHNLNLRHGGNENCNWKPNYNSVMNYRFQFPGIDVNCNAVGNNGEANTLDYSRATRISLNENSLDESQGTCGGNAPIDWNFSGGFQSGLAYDVNRTSENPNASTPVDNSGCAAAPLPLTTLNDHDDWANILFVGLSDADGRSLRPFEIIDCDNPRLRTSVPIRP